MIKLNVMRFHCWWGQMAKHFPRSCCFEAVCLHTLICLGAPKNNTTNDTMLARMLFRFKATLLSSSELRKTVPEVKRYA